WLYIARSHATAALKLEVTPPPPSSSQPRHRRPQAHSHATAALKLTATPSPPSSSQLGGGVRHRVQLRALHKARHSADQALERERLLEHSVGADGEILLRVRAGG